MLESTTRLVGDQYIQYATAEKSFEGAYCFIAKFIAAKVTVVMGEMSSKRGNI